MPASARGEGPGVDPGPAASVGRFERLSEKDLSLADFFFHVAVREGEVLTGRAIETGPSRMELDRLSSRISARLGGRREPGRVLSAMRRVLFGEEGFIYDPDPGDPENFLLDRVLSGKRGNCLGLTAVYLAIADRLDLPFRAVYVPGHCFVRYEGNGARINVETGEKGIERKDEWYAGAFRLKGGSPYLRSLGRKETIGLYLKSLGTASSRKGREEEALLWYREASRFYPGLPDLPYNAGVSYQRLGRNVEAIERYRAALALYADMAPARGNLAAALCACGRIEEGIREFRRSLEIDPTCAVSNAGLAKAYIASGDYRAAQCHCDQAMERGCRFDPALLDLIARHGVMPAGTVR